MEKKRRSKPFRPYCKKWFKIKEFEDGFFYSFFYKTINIDDIPYMYNVWKNRIEFHPVAVLQYALNAYNNKKFKLFLKRVNFLVYKQEDGWLYHNFKLKMWGYKFKCPWVSGMAQGMFLSCLVRAHGLTKDKRYSDLAKKVFKTLKSSKVYKKGWFYEFGTKNPRVLNGHLYTLIGLKEYGKPISEISEMDEIKFTEYNGWTRYDDKNLVANPHYHKRHINLYKEVYGEEFYFWENEADIFLWPCLIYQKLRGLLQ